MDLTEGEASSVFTAKLLDHKFQEGESFIVCDAGGGTTDVCVLQVKRVQDEMVELELLDDPKAIAVGSVDIDDMFESRALEQLRTFIGIPQDEAMLLAHQITREDFQTFKTGFGEVPDLSRIVYLAVPNSTERIQLTRDHLKDMFDSQIRQIFTFIDQEISFLRTVRPDVTLSYIFLAGGLGSSKYVQDELVGHYTRLKVLFAPVPEDLPLAVCKGLVIDRLQFFSNNLPVIPIRFSNASYGILCKEIYQKKHAGQQSVKNDLDGKKYAENQIDWFVLRDEKPLWRHSITKLYSLIVDTAKVTDSWSFSVVRSTLEHSRLPTFLDGKGGAKVMCHVISDSGTSLHDCGTIQKRRLIGKRFVYSRVVCELSAMIGVAKMEFTGRVVGYDNMPQVFKVQWPADPQVEDSVCCDLIRSIP
ncbi:uncharacterized protein PAC_01319 [Phialocephala subalpina]|uniref:Hsp70 protein n=1 Tax=Phialocephala subalpina TaxID=576137 RepID=A0A1L7WF92_9HELO|nr:uncharacterized protein PAC_01319 [Phialocephala subalpina]